MVIMRKTRLGWQAVVAALDLIWLAVLIEGRQGYAQDGSCISGVAAPPARSHAIEPSDGGQPHGLKVRGRQEHAGYMRDDLSAVEQAHCLRRRSRQQGAWIEQGSRNR